jgi:hypothetical protein
MEFPEIQFAIINDRTLGQLNISNIYFDEFDGAYLAGVLAASNSKRKAVGFIGSDPDLYASFSKGARDTFSKVKVVNIFYPDNISEVKISLAKVDIAVLDSFPKKVKLILETPDQYFANTRLAQPVILATIEKNLIKPIDQLVSSALQGSALIDVLDEPAGVYGREYNASNGGIRVTTTVPLSSSSRKAVLKALLALK